MFPRAAVIVLLFAAVQLNAGAAAPTPVDALAARGQLGISADLARDIASKIGQLMIVNVDGFGATTGDLALEPGFTDMVAELQIGGVIPHYGTTDYDRIRRTNRRLAALTTWSRNGHLHSCAADVRV